MRSPGQVRDSETGMDYFNARYFTAPLARFNSADPENAGADLSDPQTWNGYSYVRNNPLVLSDPSGQFLSSAVGAAAGVGAVIGGIIDLFAALFGLFGGGGGSAPPALPPPPPAVSSYSGVEAGGISSGNTGPFADDILQTEGGTPSDNVFYSEAIAYLQRDAVMARIIWQLQQSRRVYTVSFIRNGGDAYGNRKVMWDPTSSLRTTSGGCQSAALGLGHELAHASEQDRYPYWFAKEERVPAGPYGNQVERWAITGPETSAARKLGEPTRSNHSGRPRHEADATSRTCSQP